MKIYLINVLLSDVGTYFLKSLTKIYSFCIRYKKNMKEIKNKNKKHEMKKKSQKIMPPNKQNEEIYE